MPLSQQHQVTILKDSLSNHQSDCCGSVSECEQVERLVASLLANGQVNQQIIPILNEIHTYSQRGKTTDNLDNHITTHQDQLSSWVDSIDQYT